MLDGADDSQSVGTLCMARTDSSHLPLEIVDEERQPHQLLVGPLCVQTSLL